MKTQYLNPEYRRDGQTVTTDLIFSGYPAIDEIVFTDGAVLPPDMKIYGFAGF